MKYLVNTLHIVEEDAEASTAYAYIVEAEDKYKAIKKVELELIKEELRLVDEVLYDAYDDDIIDRLRENDFSSIAYGGDNDIGFIINEPILIQDVVFLI